MIVSYDKAIQAIGNKHPDLMSSPDKYPPRDYEYVRRWTLSLLVGIDLLTGTIHPKVFKKHRSEEFIDEEF